MWTLATILGIAFMVAVVGNFWVDYRAIVTLLAIIRDLEARVDKLEHGLLGGDK